MNEALGSSKRSITAPRSRAVPKEVIDNQQDYSTHDCTDESRAFIGPIPADSLPEVRRNERTDNSQYRGDDEATWISSRGQQFRYHPRQKPDDDRPD